MFMVFSLLVIIALIHDYSSQRNPNHLKVSFKTFHDWYALNSKRYILDTNKVEVHIGNTVEIIEFSNFIEYLKYTKFYDSVSKSKLNKIAHEHHMNILSCIQEDINNVREAAQRSVNDAYEILNKKKGL